MSAFGPRPATSVVCSVALLTIGILPSSASADRRIFAHLYPYATLPEGSREVEHYLDASFDQAADPAEVTGEELLAISWKHQIEFEYGITDHWDLGIYQYFRQKAFQSVEYRGTKIRTRYRFAEQGELPIDLSLYAEVALLSDEIEIEERIIAAKMLGPVELGLNLKIEQKLEPEDGAFELEHEFIPMLGVGWHLDESLAIGAETMAEMELHEGELEGPVVYAGPSVSVAGRGFFWTVSALPRIVGEEDAAFLAARSVLGVMF
jgi:hypothetical protein